MIKKAWEIIKIIILACLLPFAVFGLYILFIIAGDKDSNNIEYR